MFVCLIYLICVCLRKVASNTHCVVFFFVYCALCCQFLWIVNFWLHKDYIQQNCLNLNKDNKSCTKTKTNYHLAGSFFCKVCDFSQWLKTKMTTYIRHILISVKIFLTKSLNCKNQKVKKSLNCMNKNVHDQWIVLLWFHVSVSTGTPSLNTEINGGNVWKSKKSTTNIPEFSLHRDVYWMVCV